MLKFSSEKDGHTLLSHQSCSTWCLVSLVFPTVVVNWLKHAEQSVCVPKGTPWWSEGILQGTRRKVSPEKRSLSVNWSQTYFHHLLCLLMSPLHSIHFKGNMRMSDIYLLHMHCITLSNCLTINSNCPSFIPKSIWFKYRLWWGICQVCKYMETPMWTSYTSIWQLSSHLV